MNYYEWSKEYEKTADELNKVIERLKRERKGSCESVKKELTDRIAFYRRCRNEARETALHLMERHRGVA